MRVRSLVRELRPPMPHGTAKTNKCVFFYLKKRTGMGQGAWNWAWGSCWDQVGVEDGQ